MPKEIIDKRLEYCMIQLLKPSTLRKLKCNIIYITPIQMNLQMKGRSQDEDIIDFPRPAEEINGLITQSELEQL